MMTKKEFISQLTIFADRYADERLGDNNKLFASNQHLREDMLEWEQKYHSAMAANKKLEEQNDGLRGEVSKWKKDNSALNALNVTLSEELEELKERCASQYQDFLKQEQSSQNWQGNYYAMQKLKDSLAKELDLTQKKLAEDNAEKLRLHCLLQSRTEELAKREKDWSAAFAAAEERHEDFKKRSDEILATTEENLQKKQEQIEALTVWKTGAESVLDTLEEKLKNAKDVIHTQENTIEWLDGRVKRLKEKKAKKEQND